MENDERLYQMAKDMMNGDGVEEDLERGAALYKSLAEKGYLPAVVSYGKCLIYGWGVEKEPEKGLKMVRDAAEKGEPKAFLALGYLYTDGDVVEEDLAQAFTYFSKAAVCGDSDAQFSLGICYQFAEGTDQDDEKAFEWYSRAAEQGNHNAETKLGIYYGLGKVVQQDYEKAVYWYKKGAEGGSSNAQRNLSACYLYGDGVEQSNEQSNYWLRKAAENGDSQSQYDYGTRCLAGELIEENPEQGFYWLNKAAENGYGDAYHNLAICYLLGKGVEQSNEQSNYWLRKAAENGDAESQYDYGTRCLIGEIIEENPEQAFYWLNKAVENGYENACHNLAVCYLLGKGVEPDKIKAAEYLYRGAGIGNTDSIKYLVSHYDEMEKPAYTREALPEDADERVEYAKSIMDSRPDEAVRILSGLGIKGHLGASHALASHYYSDFNPPEGELMNFWLLQEAEAGDISSIIVVAISYEEGIGFKKDEKKAFRIIDDACREYPDNLELKTRLALYYIDGTGIERNINHGIMLLSSAAYAGHPYAQDRMGLVSFYQNNNIDDAMRWLEKAKANGYEQADEDMATIRDAFAKIKRAETKSKLLERKEALERELLDLKGLFTGKRRRMIQEEIAEINREIAGL